MLRLIRTIDAICDGDRFKPKPIGLHSGPSGAVGLANGGAPEGDPEAVEGC